MSDSLTGGLVPLGKRAGSGSTGSSNLSGGLIPLGNTSRTKASAGSFGRLASADDFELGGNVGRDKEKGKAKDKDRIVGEEKSSVDWGGGNKGKRSSPGKRDPNKREKEKDKHRSNSSAGGSSRRERLNAGSSTEGDRHEGNKKGNSSPYLANKLEEDEDDSYLFMGATAGTKGRKSGGGAAEAAALLLNSDDLFGLPKPPDIATTTRETHLADSIANPNTSSALSGNGAEKSNSRGSDRDFSSQAGKRGRPLFGVDETRDAIFGYAHTARGGMEMPQETTPRVDLDVDFDSPDEADELLQLTEPTNLMQSNVATSPPMTYQPLRGRTPQDRIDIAQTLASDGQSAGRGAEPKRRSPSPPSRPRGDRTDSPDHTSRRLLTGGGLNKSGSRGDLTGVDSQRLAGARDLKHGRISSANVSLSTTTSAVEHVNGLLSASEPATPSPSRGRSRRNNGNSSEQSVENTGTGLLGSILVNESDLKTMVGDDVTHKQLSSNTHGRKSYIQPQLTSTEPEPVTGRAPRRSALAAANKLTPRETKPRGVTFDDDLGDVDALDILPSSDGDEAPASNLIEEPIQPFSPPQVKVDQSAKCLKPVTNIGGHGTSEPRPAVSASVKRHKSKSMVKGLSPAAARLIVEDSLSEEDTLSKSVVGMRLGLESGLGTVNIAEKEIALGLGPMFTEGVGNIIDDPKLDIALGFTPSAMEGGRRQRRTLPAGGRRRSGASVSAAVGGAQTTSTPAVYTSSASNEAVQNTSKLTTLTLQKITPKVSEAKNESREGKRAGEMDITSYWDKSAHFSVLPAAVVHDPNLPIHVTGSAKTPAATLACVKSSERGMKKPVKESLLSDGSRSTILEEKRPDSSFSAVNKVIDSGAGFVDASVLASLERQLVRFSSDREAAGVRFAQNDQRLQRETNLAREGTAVAEARALKADVSLAEARARIRQLETEAAEHTTRLAAAESRAASDLRAEKSACLANIFAAETRHQGDFSKAEKRHEEAQSELKRLYREASEDTGRRNADSNTLKALAGQVRASAGAVDLLQAEILERKGDSEASKEGHMDARERLIKELEQSARRAQQTAEDEVQRLQGTLMAMDQVMRALRGQNAGERERLRQEHLRLETLQGSMATEAEAVRKGSEEERQRIAGRCAALDREKRKADSAARAEIDRLTEQRLKLEAERENFAALQVSAAQAAEKMARRQSGAEERLSLARKGLEREASSLEARLAAARVDLHEADDVRASLDRNRDQDELERRRLKVLAGELECAFEEVRARAGDIEERRFEADTAKVEALEASKEAKKERESVQLRSAQVEEAARRQDIERTSIAKARGQSATELSTSRRLKSELTRAFSAMQRRVKHPEEAFLMPHPVNYSLESHDIGDMGMEVGVGLDPGRFDGEPAVSLRSWAPEGARGHTERDVSHSTVLREAEEDCTYQSSPDNWAGIPFTGIAAAKATLQAISSTPSFPGLDFGRELGRLAQRASDLRQCTREQGAFISASRAARLNMAAKKIPELSAMVGVQWDTPGLLQELRSSHFVVDNTKTDVDSLEQRGAGEGRGFDALGCSVSTTVIEELEEIERACLKRSSALDEEQEFVETLGKPSSLVVPR